MQPEVRAGERTPPSIPPGAALGAARLRALLSLFPTRRILVVGDCMLDEYLWGRVSRISPEAPVLVVEELERSYAAGGASNVAANLVSLGGTASIAAVVGADDAGRRLAEELTRIGVLADALVTDPSRPTTLKTRIMAPTQQVLRLDREQRTAISDEIAAGLLACIERELEAADAVLLSDYSKGTLTEGVVRETIRLAGRRCIPSYANPKPPGIGRYAGITLLSLNQAEAEAVTGISLASLARADELEARLRQVCDFEAATVTLGGRGLLLLARDEAPRHLPVLPLEVFDPCGCGDSAIAAAALARAAGAEWLEAAELANLAGTAKVRKRGVVPVSRPELESVWRLIAAGANGHLPLAEESHAGD